MDLFRCLVITPNTLLTRGKERSGCLCRILQKVYDFQDIVRLMGENHLKSRVGVYR